MDRLSTNLAYANKENLLKGSKLLNGFTLIEILIAITIFAILATLTSSILYYAFNTRERVMEQTNRLASLQLAMSLLERDAIQIINRQIRRNEMQLVSAFIGRDNYTEFTRGGLPNPDSLEKRSTLSRIGLLCQDNQLIRRSWPSLDSINKDQYSDKVLLTDLTQCKFSYLNKTLQVLSEWQESVGNQEQVEPLPKAIQLNLTLKYWGKMSILLPIPKAEYGN